MRMRHARALVAACVLTLVLVGAPAASADTTTLKPLLTGLLVRNGPPGDDLAGVVRSYAIRIDWKTLQPTPTGPLMTDSLDAAISDARARGARLKLRVFAGAHAPDWVKALAGGPVRGYVDPSDGRTGDLPRYWTPEVGAAYARLQSLLSARYDANPTIAEVVISRCTAFAPEPFLRQTSVPGNRSLLLQAGFTVEADQRCHRDQIEAHRVWSTTRSGLALNPYHAVHASGIVTVDGAFTEAMITYCRDRLGARCVLENHSIRSPIERLDRHSAHPHYTRMYEAMRRAGPPLAFQTAVDERIGDCGATLRWAVGMHAASVELPRDPLSVTAGCSRADLAVADGQLGRPSPPRAVRASQPTGTPGVSISWQTPVSDRGTDITGYRVYRRANGTAPILVAQTGTATRTFVDGRAPRRTRVVYEVVALNAVGVSSIAISPPLTTR